MQIGQDRQGRWHALRHNGRPYVALCNGVRVKHARARGHISCTECAGRLLIHDGHYEATPA